jgi:hypothetical protein
MSMAVTYHHTLAYHVVRAWIVNRGHMCSHYMLNVSTKTIHVCPVVHNMLLRGTVSGDDGYAARFRKCNVASDALITAVLLVTLGFVCVVVCLIFRTTAYSSMCPLSYPCSLVCGLVLTYFSNHSPYIRDVRFTMITQANQLHIS